jgi:chaperonin GroES
MRYSKNVCQLLSAHRSFRERGETVVYEIGTPEKTVVLLGSLALAEGYAYPHSPHLLVIPYQGHSDLLPRALRIVEVLDEEETTVSGIVLPDTAKEKPQRGKVLAVGPGARDEDGDYIKMDVEVGDEVIFSKYGGTEIRVGTDDVLILRESDVLAKVVTTGSKGKKKLAGAAA